MRRLKILCAFGLLLAPAAAWAAPVNTTSTSSALIETTTTTNATQTVNTYSTELKARIQGGAYLYDQTFSVAYSDPSVQAAVMAAQNVLTSHGAVTFSGPGQLSNVQTLVSSSTNTVQTGPSTQISESVDTYIGPVTLTIGSWGTCTGYSAPGDIFVNGASVGNAVLPTGCTGGTAGPLAVVAGGQDIDTFILDVSTTTQTITTTNTNLITQVYELDGFPAGVSVTPAPPSLILMFTGLSCVAFWFGRRFAVSRS